MSVQTEMAVVPPKENALQVFQTPKGLDPYLQVVRDKIDAFVPDVTTRKGREAIASIAYQVSRSKTALDNRGKELVAELKEIPKLIDAERKRVRDTLDAWQEEVRRPLTEWQKAEDDRIKGHEMRMLGLRAEASGLGALSSDQLLSSIGRVESVELGIIWEEFAAEAGQMKDQVLAALREALVARQKYEVEQAELARLRAESQAREEREREERIAREATERARLEAEQAAQAEREAVARREQEAKAAAERRELEQKLRAEQAERAAEQAEANRVAAEQRAEQERQAAAERAQRAAEEARLDEQRRQKAAADEIIRQQEARAADKEHKKTICLTAQQAMVAGGIPEDIARAVILLIHQRRIPAIAITY